MRRPSGAALAAALAVLLTAAPRADAGPAWQDRADVIFRPVSQATDAPSVPLPAAIAQDAAGFLWTGGEAGLARWDGLRFRLYAEDSAQPDGLLDHNVLALHSDAAGRLWVGTVTGGLAHYDPASDHFVPVALNTPDGLASCIWSIDDDGAGGLWVGASTGLFHLDAAGQVVSALRHTETDPGSLPTGKIQAVLFDKAGTLWLGGAFGLAHGSDANRHFVPVRLPAAPGATPEISHLLQDSAGRIWIGSRQDGAFRVDPATGAATPLVATQAVPGGPAAAEILAIAQIDPTTIWLGTFGAGILQVDTATLQIRRIRHNPFVPASLPLDNVTALYTDRSGLAWVGTAHGLSLHDAGNRGIHTLWGDPDRTDGLRLNDVSAVLARPDGSLWIGSESSGLQILNPQGRPDAALAINRVFALAAAATGPVYVGSRSGLYRADAAGQTMTHLDVPQRPPHAAVNALLVDRGSIWLGGGDDGLWELHPDAAGALALARHVDRPLLTNGTLRTIAVAPDGRLALGTDRGFDLLDRATGVIERIFPTPADPHGLSQSAVMSFANDRQGRLWVGTDSKGINVLTGRDAAGRPLFRHLGRAEGLPNDDISRMLVDRQGMIWASTDNGLAEIDPASFAVRALQAPDGVVVPTYWSNSGDTMPGGELVFGGIGGITIVQPDQVARWRYRPPVVITGIKSGGRSLASAPTGNASTAPVVIKAAANSLTVDFAALDFSAPGQNRYEYRLAGFDPHWVPADATAPVAAYTNLPPGRYILYLRGTNRTGLWTEQTTALHIRVLPAWFQTLWVRLAACLAAGLLLAGLVQARTLMLRRRALGLERQVAERTVELSRSQAKLQQFAYFDALTGLPNRRAFNEEFELLLGAPAPRPFALILVDLDGFKNVNDSLGHLAGDALLVAAAGRLRQTIRDQDFISRLGGDEFAILVKQVHDQSLATSVCERIIATMAEPIALRGISITIGASAGAALFPQHGLTQDDLYRHVDLALYEAKHAGRGGWRLYRDSMAAMPAMPG